MILFEELKRESIVKLCLIKEEINNMRVIYLFNEKEILIEDEDDIIKFVKEKATGNYYLDLILITDNFNGFNNENIIIKEEEILITSTKRQVNKDVDLIKKENEQYKEENNRLNLEIKELKEKVEMKKR